MKLVAVHAVSPVATPPGIPPQSLFAALEKKSGRTARENFAHKRFQTVMRLSCLELLNRGCYVTCNYPRGAAFWILQSYIHVDVITYTC